MGDENSIHIGNGNHLTIQTSYIVTMRDELKLSIEGIGIVDLQVQIKANFETIPEEYHQTFLSMMSARYGGIVRLYDNTDSLPFEKKGKPDNKWYKFWKKNK